MSIDKLVLAAGGVVALKVFAGIDVLGMLGLNVWGPTTPSNPATNNATNPSTGETPVSTNAPTSTNTQPYMGGSGVATYSPASANSGRPTGTGMENPTSAVTYSPASSTGYAGAGNAVTSTGTSSGRNAGNTQVDEFGVKVMNALAATGVSPNFNFHQWNYLFREAGSPWAPSPEEAGMGDGTQIISLETYKTAIRRNAGLGGVQPYGMGAITLQPAINPNAGTQVANPVERMPFIWRQ